MVSISFLIKTEDMKEYSRLNELPRGKADDHFIHGCTVFEGGGWRGVYTQGVIDELMIQGINLDCSIGVSAGALMSVNYLTGQIGRGPYITLKYRHDSRFVGWRAMIENHGISGFRFMHEGVEKIWPADNVRYYRQDLRHIAVATDMETGLPRYFEKGKDSWFWTGVRAGATIPFLSEPVKIEGVPYMDGGISDPLPLEWALTHDYEKILIVKTRPEGWRQQKDYPARLCDSFYQKYPKFDEKLKTMKQRTNRILNHIDELEQNGRIFVISPSEKIEISMFSGDMEKLGAFYELGRADTRSAADSLREYLSNSDSD